MPSRPVLAALFVAGVGRFGRNGAAWHPAQRRGADAAGGRADRRAARCPTATSGGSIRPASPTCWAACTSSSGPSLLTWRIVRVLADATVAVLAFTRSRAAARARGSRSPPGRAAILAMAYPSGPHPFPIALALVLGALLAFERAAGARGRAGGRGGGVADRVRRLRRAGDPGGAPATGCAGSRSPGAATAAVLYLPVVIAAGLGPLVGPARRLPADRLPRLPDAAVPALLRRAAQHRLARRLPQGQRRAAAALLPAARARRRPGRRGCRAGDGARSRRA